MLQKKDFHVYFFDFVALIAGLLFPLAFAPFHFHAIAFLSPCLLLVAWLSASNKRAAFRGWLFGVGEFSTGISWVYISIHIYGQAPIPLAVFITGFFVLYLSLFPALQGYLLARFFPSNNAYKWTLIYPTSWVIFEILRTWLFTGFPWLLIGYTQVGTILQSFAPILGVFGVSYIVVCISSLIVLFFINLKKPLRASIFCSFLITIFLLGFFLAKITWTQPSSQPITTALIQGNIQQELKWQPQQILKTLNLYVNYSRLNFDKDLIIWPEAAITLPQTEMGDFLERLNRLVLQNKSAIITGIPIISSQKIYNGIIAIGNSSGVYTKRHLVPFGEYIPLKFVFNFVMNSFNIPMSDVTAGPKQQKPLQLKNILIAPYICYEIAYPLEFLTFLPQANLLLTITDDSWFGKSIASAQHLQMGQMRAIETGRYLLFSGNTGITAIINPKGQIERSLKPFEENVLTGKVYAMSGNTPWITWKMWPLLLLLAISCVLSLLPHGGRRAAGTERERS